MKRLSRAVVQKGTGGKPLPPVFSVMDKAGIKFRQSEVAMIAGPPGAGKSLLALWMAVQWVKTHGLRGLYFSADSAEIGQGARALAMSTHYGTTVGDAEKLIEAEDPWALEQMKALGNLYWSFESDVSYESIDEEVLAFVELWGTTPDFIIIDNLTDVDGQAEDEFAHLRRVMKGLTQLARNTGSCVIVLHHTSEDPRIKSDPCPPVWGIQGKVAQKPQLILTVADRGRERPVAAVKNRYGRPDRSGRSAYWLGFDSDTMHFRERA